MSTLAASAKLTLRPSRAGLTAIYLVSLAVVARTLTSDDARPILSQYLILELLYLLLFTVIWLFPRLPIVLKQGYFVLQSLLVLGMLSLDPEFDFIVVFFVPLGYQAALFFEGRARWAWTIAFVLLTGGSLIFYLGLVRGLALSLTTMATEIIIPAYLIVNRETEIARTQSQLLLEQLQATHSQLEVYAGQVEELAALQERSRLARDLHDTVSQLMFSIALTTRSAQLLLEKQPERLPEILKRLKELTGEALSQLRSFITQLNKSPEDS